MATVGPECAGYAHLRIVPVIDSDQLTQALATAAPGDLIQLAPGTYTGGLTISRDGTAANPITLCGPRTAIISNGRDWRSVISADWWVLKGFKITGGIVGLFAQNANNNVFDSLLIEHVGQEAIMLSGLSGSSHNTVIRNTIRYTGERMPVYGEGIYVGDGGCICHPSNNNRILYNLFGPNVTTEHVQTTGGTTGNLVQGNISDATGFQWVSANVVGIYVNYDGTNTTFLDNVIRNINSPYVHAFLNSQGSGVTFRRNSASGTFQSGFRTIGGNGNVVGCDNTPRGASSNVTCGP